MVVDEGRGDQALECKPDPLLLGRLSVWSPMLTYWVAVCVDLVDMPTAWAGEMDVMDKRREKDG